jgi:tRNA (guanine-N7-)-methyltransferase
VNIFENQQSIDSHFPVTTAGDIMINPDGQSNSGKAGRSVRLHERVTLVELSDQELAQYFRSYSGEQLYKDPESVPALDGTELFNKNDAVNWDYGCGRGERIIELAQNNPEKNYVGVDLHYRSLALGTRAASNLALDNVRFVRANATLLAPRIPDESAEAASVLFPAPLPNKKGVFDGMPSPSFSEEIHRTLQRQGSPFEFTSDSAPFFNFRMRQIGQQGLYSCASEEFSVGIGNPQFPTRYQKIWESKGIPIFSATLRKA